MSYSEEIILFTINTLNTFEDIGSVTKITSAADSEKELLWREWGGGKLIDPTLFPPPFYILS